MIPSTIHLHDTVTRRIEATDRKATGTVIYIHPEGRYYVADLTSVSTNSASVFTPEKFFKKLSEVPLTRGAYLKLPKGNPLPQRLRCTPRII